MAREKTDWNALIRSIHHNRSGNALFYKPVCVIAAIDLADIGRLDSDLLHSELILRRFSDYVSVSFPERANAGWQPLWYLANDGMWTFSKKGKRLTKAMLEARPSTKNKAIQRFDTQTIAPEYRALWESSDQRKTLRDQMLLMIAQDADSRSLLRALFDPSSFANPDRWPSDAMIEDYLQSLSVQGDLFRDHSSAASEPKPLSASAVRKAVLAFDPEELPQPSPVGPSFEVTGDAPIGLSPGVRRDVTGAQADLYAVLALKCQALEAQAATSHNLTAHIRPALNALIAALNDDPAQSNAYLIWSYGNTLRRLQEADARAQEETDPDDRPLPGRTRELLGDVVEQFNVYAMTDHIVGLLDRAKPGPAGRIELLNKLDAGAGLVEAISASSGILTADAAEVLETSTQTALDAKQSTGLNADQALINAVEIQRNGARAILHNAWLEMKNFAERIKGSGKEFALGAVKQLGAETVKLLPLTTFVHGARDQLVALWHGAANSGTVTYIVGLVREFLNLFRN
jgi:hypothetical protein